MKQHRPNQPCPFLISRFIALFLAVLSNTGALRADTLVASWRFVVSSNVAPFLSQGGASPAVGFDGTNFLVISMLPPPGSTAVDPSAFSITSLDAKGNTLRHVVVVSPIRLGSPAIAFDGTNYLLVMESGGQILGRRLYPSGAFVDDGPSFQISTGSFDVVTNHRPAVAFDGQNFLIVWQKQNTNSHITERVSHRRDRFWRSQSSTAGTSPSPIRKSPLMDQTIW